jgi:hypothetical protein
MKLLTCLVVILWASVASASPFLACDPPTESGITQSQVEYDGTWDPTVDTPNCTDKQVGCVWTDPTDNTEHFILRDLAGITDGSHTVRARFVNVWGEGEITDPFDFTKSRPGKRSVRLIP